MEQLQNVEVVLIDQGSDIGMIKGGIGPGNDILHHYLPEDLF